MVIYIDVPNDAAKELDDALHLMATYAAAREGMERARNRPVLIRRWHVVSKAVKEAADTILIPQ